jgi:outer membrane receptor for monomeric catechols
MEQIQTTVSALVIITLILLEQTSILLFQTWRDSKGTNSTGCCRKLEPSFQTKNSEQIIGEQISVQGSFTTGKIKHQLFTGIDLEKPIFTILGFAF